MGSLVHVDVLLKELVAREGSDLHLKFDRTPFCRVDGGLNPLSDAFDPLDDAALDAIFLSVVPARLQEAARRDRELDFSYQPDDIPVRFRVNLFFQKGHVGFVFRQIPSEIPSLTDLGFHDRLAKLMKEHQGLVLVTGPTGSGKSTTLAAMIREVNDTQRKHIITIEDPMEFVQTDNLCLINQREVGADTASFSEALRRALRQDPDVVLVGEMRDVETIGIATTASETGHLVLSTLHTNDAKQSIERIINAYPAEEHYQIRMKLALVLNAVVSQTLLPRKDGKGRVAALEVMVNTPTIRKMIEEGDIGKVDKIIEESNEFYGMCTKNQALFELWKTDVIEEDVALGASNAPNNLKLLIESDKFGSEIGGASPRSAGANPTNLF